MNKSKTTIKKYALMFVSVLLIAFIGIFASACGEEKNPTKNIASVSANNLEEYYHNTATIDFSAVTLNVTYDDNTNVTMTNGEVDIDIANAESTTQFVLYTDGLGAMEDGNLSIGTYDITCQIVGNDTVYNLGTITISDNMNLIYNLIYFGEPEFVTTYRTNIGATEQEDSFYSNSEIYTVGDDNEFVFKPEMSLMSKENSTIYEPSDFDVDVKVYLVVNNDSTLLEDNTYYTFSNFAFDFTDEAIGQTFRIEVTPSDFSADISGNAVNPVTFTFKVEDGWNAYTADDIARINIVDYDVTEFARYQSQDIFYNADTQVYERRLTYDIWEQHLAEKGYASESLHSINGIYMHGNISITPEDIPDDFFVTEAESAYAAGSLRDFSLLYMHYLNNNFVFNGNYFMIDVSELPLGLSNTSYSGYIYSENQARYYPGHSTVFSFSGKVDNTTTETATFKNVNSIGNTGGVVSIEGDSNEAIKASGGLILLKSIHATTNVDNSIAKEYLIAWYGESSLMDRERGNIYINGVKTYDCFNSGAFAYASDMNTISNSEFKRFGGPVILMVSEAENGVVDRYAGFTIDDNSVLESYVNGTEAWFVMQQATQIASQLIGLELLLNQCNNSMMTPIEVTSSTGQVSTKNCMNLIALVMDQDYLASTEQKLFADYLRGEASASNQAFSTYNNAIINGILEQSQYRAPVFMSNAGDIGYTTGASIDFATGSTQFNGNELYVLYPLGSTMAGLVLDLKQLA